MVVRTPAESEKHEKIIRMMLNHFKDKGYTNLKADLENETLPDQIGDYVPDLTCYKNNEKKTPIFVEAETCGTISHEHTKGQWKAFYRKSREVNGEFHLAVPRVCNCDSGQALAKQRLDELNIKAHEVWMVNHSL
jgi:hypothetical protein